MTQANTTYELSAILQAHSQDIKALVALSNDLIVSASRDTKVIVWERNGPSEFHVRGTFQGHSHFVNALTYMSPNAQFPNGLVISGGADKLIYCFDPSNTSEAVYTLVGHQDNVCALSVFDDTIISGSWDKTAKVWKNGQLVTTLTSHAHAVWGVLAIDSDSFVTASADKTIKIWKGSKSIKTVTGHSDVVRSLVRVPSLGFASCSNDASIRVWTLAGEPIFELSGHTSFVYSLSLSNSGNLTSSGEDRSVRIWEGEKLAQTVTQPCTSVWCVANLPNDDIAVGGSDGVVRVFTKDHSRVAPADIIDAFKGAVSSSAIPSNQVGDIDKSKLPGLDALNVIGKKEGEVKMVRVGNVVEAYQWSMSEAQWIKIGEVTDAVGSSRKQVYEGKEYDYVFDVDIQEGVPPLKLPYNVNENPYQAAQDFIHKYELPQDYLDQIASFVISNTKGVSLGAAPVSTGRGEFNNPDPYTGSSSSSQPKLIPMGGYSYLKVASLKPLLSKVLQINGELENSVEYGSVALSSGEFAQFEEIVSQIEKRQMSLFTLNHYALLKRISYQWPSNNRFPGLDVLRLVVAETSVPFQDDVFLSDLLTAIGPCTDKLSKFDIANWTMGLRVLANSFAKGIEQVFKHKDNILKHISPFGTFPSNGNARIALATVLLNFSVLNRQRGDDAFAVDLLETVISTIKSESDGEAATRLLVALGNLLYGASSSVKEAAQLLDARSVLSVLSNMTGGQESRLRQAESEVQVLL